MTPANKNIVRINRGSLTEAPIGPPIPKNTKMGKTPMIKNIQSIMINVSVTFMSSFSTPEKKNGDPHTNKTHN